MPPHPPTPHPPPPPPPPHPPHPPHPQPPPTPPPPPPPPHPQHSSTMHPHLAPHQPSHVTSRQKRFPHYWPFVGGIHRPLGDFPNKGPVISSFNISFAFSSNKLMNEHPSSWWFETPWKSRDVTNWQDRARSIHQPRLHQTRIQCLCELSLPRLYQGPYESLKPSFAPFTDGGHKLPSLSWFRFTLYKQKHTKVWNEMNKSLLTCSTMHNHTTNCILTFRVL